MTDIDKVIRCCADPEAAQRRFDDLNGDSRFQTAFRLLTESQVRGLILILGYSDFLANYIKRFPAVVQVIGDARLPGSEQYRNADELRAFKYVELLKLTARDLLAQEPYDNILLDTSHLADDIICSAHSLLIAGGADAPELCILGMGKLGALELNYSSDIDLIFVCPEPQNNESDYIEFLINRIRKFTRTMEEVTGNGFLYRVDLKLRPWGRSGPLILSVEDTENYYSASTEAWERFIWLRARAIAGNRELGNELLGRLAPFVYRKTLSDDDLRRFLEIKAEMQSHHRKDLNWNVKQGRGGIRDIEFFLQLLQIVNASDQPELKSTNTLQVLAVLNRKGFLQDKDAMQIRDSYLFLRRLENHLQMIGERQTHHLPDDKNQRRRIARSLVIADDSNEALDSFEEQLGLHQSVARNCFERILPKSHLLQSI